MKIAITSQDSRSDFVFDAEPWLSFAEEIRRNGHEIVKIDKKPEAVIFNNFSKSIYRKLSRQIPTNRRFLIVWEPPCNAPENFNDKNRGRFSEVLFPSPIWQRRFNGLSFPWPQNTYTLDFKDNWSTRKDKFCLIQANRWRFSKGDKYCLRREILSLCSDQIDLYGRNWNQGPIKDTMRLIKSIPDSIKEKSFSLKSAYGIGVKYQTYRGVAKDKIKVLEDYRYSLVIENSDEYVSEKIVDAILAGTIPVYVGANLSHFGFPENIAQICSSKTAEIRKAMSELQNNEAKQGELLKNGRDFLKSDFFQSLNNRLVLTALAREICQRII